MGNIVDKPVIGILGGIGSGKSTVAAEFAKLGCKVIDADKIAHGLLSEPDVRETIVDFFGNQVLSLASRGCCLSINHLRGVVADESGKDARTAHITLYHDSDHPSYIEIPVAKYEKEE